MKAFASIKWSKNNFEYNGALILSANWTDWEVIYSKYWTIQFNSIVRKRIPYSPELAEKTMEDVRQELAIKLCKLKTAPLAIKSYLHVAFKNTLEDYLRSQHGYPRPPEFIKRLGAAYVRIHKLLCLEHRSINEIHAMLDSLYQYSRTFVERIVREVRAGVVNCGATRDSVPLEYALAEVETNAVDTPPANNPEAILANMNIEAIINAILNESNTNDSETNDSKTKRKISRSFLSVLQALRHCLQDDDERLLIRLVYSDGYAISKAAKVLKLSDSKARKLLKDITQRLSQVLEKV